MSLFSEFVPGGWALAPEGAAVHRGSATAVIADVHLGYEWARGAHGDVVPAHSLAETLGKLESLLGRATIRRLVVAGDLVESSRPCAATARALVRLADWLDRRGLELVRLRGNHDPPRPILAETAEVAGWTVGHGDRRLARDRLIVGHHHPVLRVGGLVAPCFLVGPGAIALPAFSDNAAGFDVGGGAPPAGLGGGPWRCLAGLGGILLDFGPIAELRARLDRAREFRRPPS